MLSCANIKRSVVFMEFNEKLQELRKKKGLTQEELAQSLYVSRTAVSKWESGRGYPNIDSLRAVAKFFSVTLDELLSTDEILNIAEENTKQREKHLCDMVYGLLDISMMLLLFLPFFAEKSDEIVQSVSLISLSATRGYLKTAYLTVVALTGVTGVVTLLLQNLQNLIWSKYKTKISLWLGVLSVLLFSVCSQPYASVFAFSLLVIKALMLIKRR